MSVLTGPTGSSQYPMWGGTGPRFGGSGPRNKWFHKTAPDPTLPRQIERTRQFAKTLRQSDGQRLWSAKYQGPKKPGLYRSVPDLSQNLRTMQVQPTIPDGKNNRLSPPKVQRRSSLRISRPPQRIELNRFRSSSLNSNSGSNLDTFRSNYEDRLPGNRGRNYSLVPGMLESRLPASSRTASMANLPDHCIHDFNDKQPSHLVITKPVKLVDKPAENIRSRSRSYTRTNTNSSLKSSISLKIGGSTGVQVE